MASLPWLRSFKQITFDDGSTGGITAPAVSDTVARTLPAADVRRNEVPDLPPLARLLVVLAGTIDNTEVTVSVGVTDVNGITGWSAPQTIEVRSLPSGTKIVGMFSFPTLRAASLTAFLESAIVGGGTAKLYIAFQDV